MIKGLLENLIRQGDFVLGIDGAIFWGMGFLSFKCTYYVPVTPKCLFRSSGRSCHYPEAMFSSALPLY